MKVNVEKLKTFIKKATVNHSIDGVQIVCSPQMVSSKMISRDCGIISMINMPNDIFSGVEKDGFTLNFIEPNAKVVPFLNMFVGDIDVKVHVDKIEISDGEQDAIIRQCFEQAITVFKKNDLNFFESDKIQLKLDSRFVDIFQNVKKVGVRFGKIYFVVDNNVLYMETTNREEVLSNVFSVKIANVQCSNMVLPFNLKLFTNIISVIDSISDFTLEVNKVKDMGFLYFYSSDGSEKYFLSTQKEII